MLWPMAYSSFRQFVDALEKAGELTRISIPVDTDLLIAEWANREMKSPGGGKALLFENPAVDGKPSKFPVAINTMGSRRRMALALQVSSVEDLAQEIQLILKAKPPTDLREGWSLLKQGLHLLHARPKHSKEGACQEVVHLFEEIPSSKTQAPKCRMIWGLELGISLVGWPTGLEPATARITIWSSTIELRPPARSNLDFRFWIAKAKRGKVARQALYFLARCRPALQPNRTCISSDFSAP